MVTPGASLTVLESVLPFYMGRQWHTDVIQGIILEVRLPGNVRPMVDGLEVYQHVLVSFNSDLHFVYYSCFSVKSFSSLNTSILAIKSVLQSERSFQQLLAHIFNNFSCDLSKPWNPKRWQNNRDITNLQICFHHIL